MTYNMMKVDDFKIAKEYQRHISPSAIKKGGPLDLNKLTPIVACKRPDGDYFVVDGQHPHSELSIVITLGMCCWLAT